MTSSILLKRVTHYAGAFVLAGAMFGCGDDGGGTSSPDASTGGAPDGGTGGAPDAAAEACQGHACPDISSPFQLPEGGEFRLERFQFGENDTDDALAAQAFFFKGQEPAFRPLDGNPLTIRQALADQGYFCTDFRAGNFFDNGKSTEAQAILNTREYYDVGATALLTNPDNAADIITLTKQAAGSTDLSANLQHEILYQAPDNTDVSRAVTYVPSIEGSLAYPALDLTFGESNMAEEFADQTTGQGTPQIYMPPQFQFTDPTEANFFGGVTFTKNADFTFTYDKAAEAPAGWPTIVPFVSFVVGLKVEGLCIKVPTETAAPDDGTFTLPYEILDVVNADPPNPGTESFMLFGRFTHVAWEYKQDSTRLDLLGIECKFAPYTIQDAVVAAQ